MTQIRSGGDASRLDVPHIPRIDTSEYEAALDRMRDSAEHFSRVFTISIRDAVLSGRELDDTLRGIGRQIASMALSQALGPLQQILTQALAPQSTQASPSPHGGSPPASANSLSQVTMNVFANDARSFQRSRGQLLSLLTNALAQSIRYG